MDFYLFFFFFRDLFRFFNGGVIVVFIVGLFWCKCLFYNEILCKDVFGEDEDSYYDYEDNNDYYYYDGWRKKEVYIYERWKRWVWNCVVICGRNWMVRVIF